MITGKKDSALLSKQTLVFSLLAVFSCSVMAAPAPVEDSVPMGASSVQTGVSQISDQPVRSIPSDQVGGADNSTAHLINTLNQMQQELMEVRGQLEEQAFLIDKLQRENRERYVDLDDRITRLSNSGSATPSTARAISGIKSATPPLLKPLPEVVNEPADIEEEKAYQAAFSLIRSKQFDEAKAALQKQLKTYPTGRFAANSYYWLGEVDMAQGRYDEALASFLVVIKDFSKSAKVPDASYKLGRIYDLKGERDKSKALLEAVIEKYPGSAAARLSGTYLRAMGSS